MYEIQASTATSGIFTRRYFHFTHRRFYTQTPSHTHTLLHTDTFTHMTLLHTDAFTHRRFYTQTLAHTQPVSHITGFTHNQFYTPTI
jgi:hypothetical protein